MHSKVKLPHWYTRGIIQTNPPDALPIYQTSPIELTELKHILAYLEKRKV